MNVRHFFLTKNFGQKNEGGVPTSHQKIPEKKKWRCNIFLLTKNPGQKSWTKKGVFFLLDVPPSRAKNPGQEKGVVLFGLPKILDQKRMKVRHFLLTKNLGQKKGVNCFCLMSHLVAPKILNKKKMNVRHFVLPKILDKIKIKVRHIFAYQKSWTKKKVKFLGFMSHLVPEKILNKKKMNVRHFFTENFGQEKNEREAYFCLMHQRVTKTIPEKKKWRCNIFLLTKNPGQRGQRSWNKKGVIFFCLVSHLIAPKSWTRKK